MKKLMTMLAAVGMAFGLFAADAKFISGAGFDTSDADAVGTKLTWTTPTGFSALWSGTDGAAIKVETGHTGIADNNHPLYFSNDSDRLDDQHLTIQTTGGALVSQKIAADPVEIGDDGLYFDGLVQFTSFEDAPAIDDDAKIAVFPMVDDPDAETPVSHLIIKAFGTETNLWTTTETITDDAWRRVTIKMIKNIKKSGTPQVGFVVFLDGSNTPVRFSSENDSPFNNADLTPEAAYFNDLNALFGSLIEDTAEITDVAFGGKGAIDEIAFTETVPTFAGSPKFAWIKGAEHIASFEYDTKTWNEGNDALIVQILPIGETTGTADVSNIKAADGYFVTDTTAEVPVTAGETNTVGEATALGATVQIEGQDDQYFETAAAALTEFLNLVETPTEAKLVLNAETSDAITIDNENLELTLDLNGKTITQGDAEAAINVNAGALTIVDNAGGGIVSANTELEADAQAAVLAWSGTLVITDGQYDGLVTGTTIAITGGEFLASANDKETLQEFVTDPDAELVEEDGYFVLKTVTDFTVTVPEKKANTTLAVTIDDADAGTTNGTYTVAKGSTLKAVYTADEGYELDEGEQGEWTVDYDSKDTVVIDAPTAHQIMVDFTVADVTGATLLAVSNGNEEVEFKDNKYTVPTNATVTLYYAPAAGYKLTKTTATKQITDADQVVNVSDEIAPAQIEYVAEVNGTQFETFAEAVAAVADGQTIKLLKDCPAAKGEDLLIKADNVTLDLNEFTLTHAEVAGDLTFGVASGKTLTVTNGTISMTSGANGFAIGTNATAYIYCKMEKLSKSNPVLDIYGGKVYCNELTDLSSECDIFRFKEADLTSEVYVSGGKYKTTVTGDENPCIFHHYKDNHTAKIEITGGEFDFGNYLIDAYKKDSVGPTLIFTKLGAGNAARFSKATLASPHSNSVITEADVIAADCKVVADTEKEGWFKVAATQLYVANLFVDGQPAPQIELGTDGEKFAKGEKVVATKPGVIDDTVEPDFAKGKTYYVEKLVLFGELDKVCEFEFDGTTLTKKGDDGIGVELQGNILTYTVTTGDLNPFGAVYVKEYVASQPVVPGKDIKTDKTPADINNSPELKKQLLKAPDGATVGDDYYGYFDAVNGSESGTVKFLLNNTGSNKVVEVEGVANSNALAQVLAATGASTTMTVPADAVIPGFYYSLKQSGVVTTLDFNDPGDANKLATGKNTITFELVKPENAGFYQTIVTPVPVETNRADN